MEARYDLITNMELIMDLENFLRDNFKVFVGVGSS